jgi:hypothetical protein
MKLAQFYHHIDNGGLLIRVLQSDDEYKNVTIEMEASYHGYPSVVSTMGVASPLSPKKTSDILQEIGVMFFEAASKTK